MSGKGVLQTSLSVDLVDLEILEIALQDFIELSEEEGKDDDIAEAERILENVRRLTVRLEEREAFAERVEVIPIEVTGVSKPDRATIRARENARQLAANRLTADQIMDGIARGEILDLTGVEL